MHGPASPVANSNFFAKTNYFNYSTPHSLIKQNENIDLSQYEQNVTYDFPGKNNANSNSAKKGRKGARSSVTVAPEFSTPNSDAVVEQQAPKTPSNKYAFLKRNQAVKKANDIADIEVDKPINNYKGSLVGAVNEANDKLDIQRNKPTIELSERSIKDIQPVIISQPPPLAIIPLPFLSI